MATQAEVADFIGISQQAFAEHVRNGVVKKAARGGYEIQTCVQAYAEHLRSFASGGGSDSDLVQERTRLAKEQADKLAFDNAVRRGELVPAADVVAAWQTTFAHVRAKMLALPSRMAAQVANLNKPAVVKEKLTAVVHDALDELSRTRGVPIPEDPVAEDGGLADGGDADLGAAAVPDGKRVGRSKPRSKPRGKRRARKVVDKPS